MHESFTETNATHIEHMNTNPLESGDPKVHPRNIGGMLDELVNHVREDIDQVEDPKAQVLFETTAEVLSGLRTAYKHFETGSEKAMR